MKKLLLVAFVAMHSLHTWAQKIETKEVEIENRSNTKVTGDLLLQAGELQILGGDPKIRLLESGAGDDFVFNVTDGRFRIQEWNGGAIERFTINNGKIGIGTPSPGYKFQVGSGRASIAPSADQNADIYSTGGITMQGDKFLSLDDTYKVHANMTYEEGSDVVHSQGRFRLEGYYGFRFVTKSALEAMMIRGNDGYVGIGTTSPAYKFQVGSGRASIAPQADQNADIYSTGGITMQGDKFLSLDDTYKVHANMTYEEGSDVVHTQGRFRLEGYYGFRFITKNAFEAMMIKGDNGYVGIGTTSPNEKLHVAGKIRATGQEGWSDFVFYDDYDLPTLEEVESHIKEKGHLQDIPSEAEVLEEGIDLTEMDSKLLQKIEELTLYLIEQNKEMKDLKSRLEKAEKALEEVDK